ncbi:hypothetical protein AXX12_13675 [Anaerosporomusa subterranea]|uniref:DUF456 domain-containing protein n=1 Tax=Anaerosporomusa subterranea TaxID=1794912 RepID=A0A154BMR5_ANASB|nr:DUF456 domain-containing protein [Anaerosporomusa subterranea]KYZ75212.1 hypothetical protein AXX12_13675 [Anaerosporomusa subterranea]
MDVGFWLLYAVSGLFVFILVLSTIFGLPGNFLLLLFAAGVGYYEGFNQLNWSFLAMLTGAWVLGEAAEFFSSAIGAKRAQASRRAIFSAYVGAFLGMLAGTAILPVVGTLAGSMIGAFAAGYWGEFQQTGSGRQARNVAVNVVIGQLFGLVFKLAVGLAMAVAILARLPIGG